MSDSHDLIGVFNETYNDIMDKVGELPPSEQVMVLCYLAKHLNVIVDTVFAHDYHQVIYNKKEPVDTVPWFNNEATDAES